MSREAWNNILYVYSRSYPKDQDYALEHLIMERPEWVWNVLKKIGISQNDENKKHEEKIPY